MITLTSVWDIANKIGDMKLDCQFCGTRIRPNDVEWYLHDGGIPIDETGGRKAWIYFECRKCKYGWALWKLLQQAHFLEPGEANPWQK